MTVAAESFEVLAAVVLFNFSAIIRISYLLSITQVFQLTFEQSKKKRIL
jgi:hypothetical protein